MDQLHLKAYAKINLGLDVIGKRPDGYHEVRMIMQTIQMYDRITLTKKSTPGIELTTDADFIPNDPSNLVYRAADAIYARTSLSTGLSISLKKFIPVAAGMAGGSSDAAAVLFGMNRLFRLGLSTQELMDIGVTIGADVPYCILRGTALAEGIGEVLTPLSPCPDCFVLIAKPPIGVSTKEVYTALDMTDVAHPDIDGLMEAIKVKDLTGMASLMGNVLQTVTIPMHPEIQDLIDFMKERRALNAMMSGSGPTVFGLYNNRFEAEGALNALRAEKPRVRSFLTGLYNNK